MEYKWVKAAVNNYGVEMTAKMIAILKSDNSKNLVNHIDQKIIEDMNMIALEIKMPEYGKFASEGRNPGNFPPLESVRKWMELRGIDLAALYPISRKIADIGTKASANHFLKEFKLTSKFEQDVLDAYSKDIQEELVKYIDKINAE